MSKEEGPLSREEIQTLILALANGQGEFTQEDVEVVYSWAAEARVAATLLKATLGGKLHLRVVNGEVCFYKD